jgi:alpha-D-ribose 1-methylphosphonate 5-triphosphate synthase subunit PhnH
LPLALAVIGSKVAIAGAPAWQQRICRATGASAVGIGDASLAAIYGRADAALVLQLRRGSAAVPEDGAKVALACEALIAGGPGQVTLRLSGPGVPGQRQLGIDGVGPEVFEAVRSANAKFPAGIDVWLVDTDGQVAGLPRSARHEVI